MDIRMKFFLTLFGKKKSYASIPQHGCEPTLALSDHQTEPDFGNFIQNTIFLVLPQVYVI